MQWEYRNQPSILALEGKLKSNSVFAFCHVILQDILKELGNHGDDDGDDDDNNDELFLRSG